MSCWKQAAALSGLHLLLACSCGHPAVANELADAPARSVLPQTTLDGGRSAAALPRLEGTARQCRAWRQTGLASWYGAEHQGKRTASGARFDMNALTAAHRSLPLGTLLRVENLANRRSVLVRISDRGPFAVGRIIDLSLAAARRIGLEQAGTGRVSLSIALAE